MIRAPPSSSMHKTRVGYVSARVTDRLVVGHQIAEGGDKQARHAMVRTQEAACFPRFRIQTESGTCQAPDFLPDLDKGSLHRGPQANPKGGRPSRKMGYRQSNSGEYQSSG